MSRKVDAIKELILDQVLSMSELENIMAKNSYQLMESDDDGDIKFTNFTSQVWIEADRDASGDVLITKVKRVNKVENEPTRVEPFRTYEDLEKVLNCFYDNGYYNHWITGWLMVSLGRRVGDTVALKWSDIYKRDGRYRERLTQLKEEKTGKKLAPIFNVLAKTKIEEYIKLTGVEPMKNYTDQIVDNSSAAFRKMLKKAVDAVDINYPISTHSFRKYWANTIYRLHPQDADNLMIVQTMLGHSDIMTTKIYINEIDRKQDKYNEDYSQYMLSKGMGLDVEISNSPIIPLKADDFRELVSKCYDDAKNGADKFEVINKIIGLAEKLML